MFKLSTNSDGSLKMEICSGWQEPLHPHWNIEYMQESSGVLAFR